MRYIVFYFLLLSCTVFAQDLDYIKSADTIYLYFDVNEKFDDLHLEKVNTKYAETYVYQFPDTKALYFENRLIKSYNNKSIVVSNDFINKNRNKIVTINTLNKYNFTDIQDALYRSKRVFYIIDKAEFKRRKIVLKKVHYLFIQKIEM